LRNPGISRLSTIPGRDAVVITALFDQLAFIVKLNYRKLYLFISGGGHNTGGIYRKAVSTHLYRSIFSQYPVAPGIHQVALTIFLQLTVPGIQNLCATLFPDLKGEKSLTGQGQVCLLAGLF